MLVLTHASAFAPRGLRLRARLLLDSPGGEGGPSLGGAKSPDIWDCTRTTTLARPILRPESEYVP